MADLLLSGSRTTVGDATDKDGVAAAEGFQGSRHAASPKVKQSSAVSPGKDTGKSAKSTPAKENAVAVQLTKTKMCAFFERGRCASTNCRYAHSAEELRRPPNLVKTKLCKAFLQNSCHDAENCMFAHGEADLKFTDGIYKTQMCNFFERGYCKKADRCNHAHGRVELRSPAVGVSTPKRCNRRAGNPTSAVDTGGAITNFSGAAVPDSPPTHSVATLVAAVTSAGAAAAAAVAAGQPPLSPVPETPVLSPASSVLPGSPFTTSTRASTGASVHSRSPLPLADLILGFPGSGGDFGVMHEASGVFATPTKPGPHLASLACSPMQNSPHWGYGIGSQQFSPVDMLVDRSAHFGGSTQNVPHMQSETCTAAAAAAAAAAAMMMFATAPAAATLAPVLEPAMVHPAACSTMTSDCNFSCAGSSPYGAFSAPFIPSSPLHSPPPPPPAPGLEPPVEASSSDSAIAAFAATPVKVVTTRDAAAMETTGCELPAHAVTPTRVPKSTIASLKKADIESPAVMTAVDPAGVKSVFDIGTGTALANAPTTPVKPPTVLADTPVKVGGRRHERGNVGGGDLAAAFAAAATQQSKGRRRRQAEAGAAALPVAEKPSLPRSPLSPLEPSPVEVSPQPPFTAGPEKGSDNLSSMNLQASEHDAPADMQPEKDPVAAKLTARLASLDAVMRGLSAEIAEICLADAPPTPSDLCGRVLDVATASPPVASATAPCRGNQRMLHRL
eukprot:TRINITY_DN23561_c0_g1_i1.p1 TRINITY_DN23561_c0_g1~~TRINITY_DN23561_c0_g1_i1.p1  ORF type:complete len:729 (-),score=152.64 TRINITY_DN23561_c0_g1_i1:59-2245(-)